MSGKYALIIANTEYTDPGLAQLTAPGKDADDFARVLKDKKICAFDEVNILLNQPEHIVRKSIDDFFDRKKLDDLLVLYFSGHGVRDELGTLYLAVKNTNRFRLRSTAIKSDFIRDAMDQSRSKRQVLILDCCNSGAFAQGTKAATGVSIGTTSAFEAGYGRVILTASDSTQFAWEGDKIIGETDNSLFTHFLVEGLQGQADLDGDGRITVDELYDYTYERVKSATPKQTPFKFSSKQQGEIVLRENMPIEEIRFVPLPAPILYSIENPFAEIRLGTVQQLKELLKDKNLGLARSARKALEKIVAEDDSRRVAESAAQALKDFSQAEQATHKKPLEVQYKDLQVSSRSGLRNWARVAGIVGGLGALGLIMFWLGGMAVPLFSSVSIESTDIVPIVLAPASTPTTTPSFTALPTDSPTLTSVPCFKLLIPENGAAVQPTNTITFSWETMLGATKYRLEITTPDETVISKETGGLSIDFPPDSMPAVGTYQWQVVAYDANEAILCTAGPFKLTRPEYVFPSPTKIDDIVGNSNSIVRTLPPRPTPTFTRTPIPTITPTFFATLPPPGPSNPTVRISPMSGPPGTRFTIALDNFIPNEYLTIQIFYEDTGETVSAFEVTISDLGNLEISYISPTNAPAGSYRVYAFSAGSISRASSEFAIIP